jgi:hypothetical protein
MGSGSWNEEPRALEVARERFESWRRTRKQRRIPEELWALAAKIAGSCGAHRTAQALRLNPQSLRERMTTAKTAVSDRDSARRGFVELAPVAFGGPGSWVVELSSSSGARMRIEAHGERLDVEALARGFLSSAR